MAITQEPFDALLAWLGPDREAAGQKYELIRSGLIRIFVSHGFSDAEDLADLTINRVVDRLQDIREGYVGEPARYFHGVARNIIREARRRKEVATDRLPERPAGVEQPSDAQECLLRCLGLLSDERRELLLDYYLYEGRSKIEHHREMARELGITAGALRIRVHHIRAALEKCAAQCVKSLAEKRNDVRGALLKERQGRALPRQERQP